MKKHICFPLGYRNFLAKRTPKAGPFLSKRICGYDYSMLSPIFFRRKNRSGPFPVPIWMKMVQYC